MPLRAPVMARLAGLLLAGGLWRGLAVAQDGAPAPAVEAPAAGTAATNPAPPSLPPPDPAPTTAEPFPPAAEARRTAEGKAESERQNGWVDQGHRFLEAGLFWPFIQLDDFFADERQVRPTSPGSNIHWRQDLRARGDGSFGYATSLRASLRFPFLSHRWERLSLTVSGQTADALDPLLPGDVPVPAGRRDVAIGVGLTILETLQTATDVRVGLLAGLPPGSYGRVRLRHAVPFGEVLLCRLSAAGFWQTNTGWGTREEVNLDRLLAPWLFSRLAGVATLTQRSRGLEWGEELGLTATFGRSAFALAGGASGATEAGRLVEVWRVLTRARRDVWRRWLFLELEPQVTWTHRPGGGRARAPVVLLRLDVRLDQRPAVRGLPTGEGGDPHARP